MYEQILSEFPHVKNFGEIKTNVIYKTDEALFMECWEENIRLTKVKGHG